MLTELLICHCDKNDEIIYGGQHLLTNDQLSELDPGCFFYYRKDGTKRDIDQPCDTTQLFMVCRDSDFSKISHLDYNQEIVENHISVIEIASGEIYHENPREWIHFIGLVNLRVFVK